MFLCVITYVITVVLMLRVKVRRVGNSLGFTIPREEAERLGLAEGDEALIEIKKPEKSFFGVWKGTPSFSREEEDREI